MFLISGVQSKNTCQLFTHMVLFLMCKLNSKTGFFMVWILHHQLFFSCRSEVCSSWTWCYIFLCKENLLTQKYGNILYFFNWQVKLIPPPPIFGSLMLVQIVLFFPVCWISVSPPPPTFLISFMELLDILIKGTLRPCIELPKDCFVSTFRIIFLSKRDHCDRKWMNFRDWWRKTDIFFSSFV